MQSNVVARWLGCEVAWFRGWRFGRWPDAIARNRWREAGVLDYSGDALLRSRGRRGD